MNARKATPTPKPAPTRPPDDFSLARQLVRRIRKGDAKAATAAADWQAERDKLLAEAPPVARAAAEAMLKLPSTVDAVLEPQAGDPDFDLTDD